MVGVMRFQFQLIATISCYVRTCEQGYDKFFKSCSLNLCIVMADRKKNLNEILTKIKEPCRSISWIWTLKSPEYCIEIRRTWDMQH